MKIKISVCTNIRGSEDSTTIEVDEKKWNNMNETEKNIYIWNEIQNIGMIEWWYEI